MSKKQLKQRIKELEFENEMLRAMRPYPIYYRVWGGDETHEPPKSPEDNSGWWTPPYEIGSGSIGSDPDAKYRVWY